MTADLGLKPTLPICGYAINHKSSQGAPQPLQDLLYLSERNHPSKESSIFDCQFVAKKTSSPLPPEANTNIAAVGPSSQ